MLHYKREGKGETLLFIHGFLGTNRVYEDILPDFIKTYEVIAIDLPGHGQSPLNGEKTVYDYAKSIIRLLDELHIARATWIGDSLGGYITMSAIEHFATYVNRAALLYASPVADGPKEKRMRKQDVKMLRHEGMDKFLNQRIMSYFNFNAKKKQLKKAFQLAKQTSHEGAIAAMYAMKDRPDQVDRVNQADIPLLFIEGKYDVFEQPFPGISPYITRVLTNTSHMGLYDQPSQCKKELLQWLSDTNDIYYE